jgi:hypothetical protein
MLPAEPESLEIIKARFPKALEPVWRISKIVKPGAKRPGLYREHVFDFEDGIRMIASRDTDGKETWLHLSFSVSAEIGDERTVGWFRYRVDELCFIFAGVRKQIEDPVITECAIHFMYHS